MSAGKVARGLRARVGRMQVMNATERQYAEWLGLEKRRGAVLWFAFEAIKLRLAKRTHYTPDFFVLTHDLRLECHEVKGFWREDARVKIKVASETYPFRFKAVTKRPKGDGGGWEFEVFE